MFEELKKLFAVDDWPAEPQTEVERLTAVVSELSADVSAAETKAGELRQAYSDSLLEHLAAGGAELAAKERKTINAAEAEVSDLREALAIASDRLAQATTAAQARDLAERWARVAALLREREDAVAKLEGTLTQLAEDFRDVLVRTKAITGYLPAWPSDKRAPVSAERLANDCMVRLHALSDGVLGAQRLPISTPMIKGLPTLVELAGRHSRMLMAARGTTSATSGEAA